MTIGTDTVLHRNVEAVDAVATTGFTNDFSPIMALHRLIMLNGAFAILHGP